MTRATHTCTRLCVRAHCLCSQNVLACPGDSSRRVSQLSLGQASGGAMFVTGAQKAIDGHQTGGGEKILKLFILFLDAS